MRIDFVKTLEASSPYIPGTIYFESSTSLIKVATANNQYRVYGGVRNAEYDSSNNILTITNGNGDEVEVDFSQYIDRTEYDDDSYVIATALTELNDKFETMQNDYNNIFNYIDDYPQEDSYNLINSDGVYQAIADTERVIVEAINDLNDRSLALEDFTQDIDDKVYDLSTALDNKLDSYTFNFSVNNNTISYNSGNYGSANLILDSVPTKDASLHGVTSAGLYTVITENERVVAEVFDDLNNRLEYVESLNIPDVSCYINDASYDSTNHRINFKHDSSVIAYIDATAFIKDGMVNDVSIHNGTGANASTTCLVISFNTDAGKDNIELPLTSIFNPSNYYTKTQVDSSFALLTNIPTDASVAAWGYIKSYTETDPVFSASAAAGITSTDITNWNNKVSNVQADWNATTGLSAILNKPTIPSTLDQIADGSTRKLSDYLPLAGGTMNADASINISTALGTQELSMTPTSISMYSSNSQSSIGQNYVTVRDQYDGVTELRPEALYVLSVSGANNYIGTWYKDGSICRKISSNTSYTYTFPNKTGTFAMTSDIPSAVTESTVSGWGFTKNTGTLTGVKFNNTNATINGTVAEITVTIPPEVTESTVSGWGFTKNAGTLTSHADHKLLIGSASATAASSNTITYVESLTGTATATHGDLTVTPTLKTITIPSAVTESTVSGWGFTKNTGTLTEHAKHKLTATNNNATSTSGTITFVESIAGTTTATDGDLTVTATRKSVTIPAAPGTLNTTATTAQTTSASEALSGSITLHKVAKTGTYSDLIGTPTIPAAPGTLKTNNTTAQTASASEALSGTINLHKVAKTGTYSDLIGTPTIPTVNNATITIQKGGTNVDSFTVNASSNKTINIPNELPTVTSSDNGKILEVVNGVWAAASPITVYSGSNAPSNSTGINGDIYIQS